MSDQIHDTFYYERRQYDLLSAGDDNLFVPEFFGMVPTMMHTACYRGYYCSYRLLKSGLFLTELKINEFRRKYPALKGVKPEIDEDNIATYKKLKLSIPYCGKILLGRDFIDENYIHLGFQGQTSYRTVLEFTLEEGRVTGYQPGLKTD